MTFYADSRWAVRADLAAIHASQLAGMAAPGTWGSGVQRQAVAAAARRAGIAAGQLEAPADGAAAPGIDLPASVLRVVERLAVAPADFDQAVYAQALGDGISDAEYVEIVGLVARIADIDIFCRGIGVPLRPLPAAQAGQPSRERPGVAVTELAWVPTVPNAPEGGDWAQQLYGGHPKPYIIRAMSLVPAEFRAHLELEQVQYLPLDRILDYEYRHHDGLSRPQVEIVAGRISALNECFY